MKEPAFNEEQKQYLDGYFSGLKISGIVPFAGHTPEGKITRNPNDAGENLAAPGAEAETFYGVAFDRLCKEEKLKLEQNPLDMWDHMVALAEKDAYADGGDVFRFKFHGLFNCQPLQEGYMLRCRIPGCVVNAEQMRGLAYIGEHYAGGYAHVTTRGSVQLREIKPRNTVPTIMKLYDIGLTSRGSGGDNIRNITTSPIAGADPQELYDARPLVRGLHHYILNTRNFYGLPRKFNVAFDGGGAISIMADTNDIGFEAVEVPDNEEGVDAGIYFHPRLGGVAGHGFFARETGILLKPEECVAFAAAVLRVYVEKGNRTNRKRARLAYLLESMGLESFLKEVEEQLTFSLRRDALPYARPRGPINRYAHIGFHPQTEPGTHYVGIAMMVGHMTVEQMRALADIASNFGDGLLHFTIWQNVILTGIPDDSIESVKLALLKAGFDFETSNATSALAACTGNTGCKLSLTDTKGQAAAIAAHLNQTVSLEDPVSIVLTGCPNACAQHICADIGLLGIKTKVEGVSTEAYNISLGGGTDQEQGLAREIF